MTTKKSLLGKEGTIGYFFRNCIMNTKKSKADVLCDARKAFPNNHIPDNYYRWYMNDLRKKGLLEKNDA